MTDSADQSPPAGPADHPPAGSADQPPTKSTGPAGSDGSLRSAGAVASKGVLGRGSIYSIGTVAPILANVAVVPVVTRLLGPTSYGVVATAIVVMWVAMMAGSLGMPSVITRQGILAKSGVAGARSLLVRGSLMTLGLAAVAIATSPWWDPLLEAPERTPILLALAASALFVVVENSQSVLRVLDRPGPFVALSLTATLGGPLIGLGLLTQQPSPERYLSGLILGYGAAAVVGLLLCLRGGRPHSDRGDTRAALKMGLPVIPHLVALYLASFASVFLAGHLYDTETAGRVQLALLVGSSPAVITSALNNSWAPIVYRASESERGAVLSHTARDIATLAALMSGGVALLSPWLLRLVASSDFKPLELVPAVAIVSFGCVLSVAYLANVHLVFAAGRSLWLSVITPLSLSVGVVTAYLAGRENLVLLGLGFPATYAALAVGIALLRRYLHAATWSETALLWPTGLGLAVCALGGLLPTGGTPALIRVLVAAVAGLGAVRLARRVLQ